MDPQNLIDATAKIAEVFPNAYDDGLSPAVKSSGKTLNLIPRVINAALSPLEKWILNKEYAVEETKSLLEEKLKNRNSNNIVSPEPYIAVPALQAISYCMDSSELRNMYANLLANSMDSTIKDQVHPSFVELIKQLSPFEANLLDKLSKEVINAIPIVKIRFQESESSTAGVDIAHNIIDPRYGVSPSNYLDFSVAIDNLKRLNLIDITYEAAYKNKALYNSIKNSSVVSAIKSKNPPIKNFNYFNIREGCLDITDLGKSFIKICVI